LSCWRVCKVTWTFLRRQKVNDENIEAIKSHATP
jgi:hypothetical protein